MDETFEESIFFVKGKDAKKNTKKPYGEKIIISLILLAFLYYGAHVVVFILQTYGEIH
jgi:hypothetical protein